jgi:hypothetical protein
MYFKTENIFEIKISYCSLNLTACNLLIFDANEVIAAWASK